MTDRYDALPSKFVEAPETYTPVAVTLKRDITRIPRSRLGPPRCADCDATLNPDGQCPRCADDSLLPPCHVCGAETFTSFLVGVCPAHEATPYLLPRPDDAEAVERMARAMWVSRNRWRFPPNTDATLIRFWDEGGVMHDAKADYRQTARAALAALWEGA